MFQIKNRLCTWYNITKPDGCHSYEAKIKCLEEGPVLKKVQLGKGYDKILLAIFL